MMQENDWYRIDNIAELDSPALVIYPDRVRQNIRTAIDMVGEVQRLRPHIKTHKSAEVVRLMIDAGIEQFKCATIAEAEILGMSKAKDVLLAYQVVGPKLKRFLALIRKYPGTYFSCLTDNPAAAGAMADFFSAHQQEVPVYLDINAGQNRTGIAPGEAAVQLYLQCSKLKGIKPVGLHVYDGHIRDADWNTRMQKCDAAFVPVEKMREQIRQHGLDEPRLIAGGSPTFSIHSKRKNRECSPGTFVYWDKGYADLCPEQAFLPAALVITRVISLPGETKLCLDLGHKSVAAENEIARRVFFINAPALQAVSQSEEHLVVEAGAGHGFSIGDVLYGMPYHICPTIALYERTFLVNDYRVNGEWKTAARDRKISV